MKSIACLLFSIHLGIYNCSICNEETFKYKLGESFSILDIRGDDISALPAKCNKQVNIPGNVEATLSVESAQFSGDVYWSYNSAVGMSKKVFHDDALVYVGKCHPKTSSPESVRSGLVKNFNSSKLCIEFKPDIDFRHLGGHVAGGSVKINVSVKSARCSLFESRKQNSSDCYEVCSKDRVVKTCPGHGQPFQNSSVPTNNLVATTSTGSVSKTTHSTSSISILPSIKTSSEMSPKQTRPPKQLYSIQTTTTTTDIFKQSISTTRHPFLTSKLYTKHTTIDTHTTRSIPSPSSLTPIPKAFSNGVPIRTSQVMTHNSQTKSSISPAMNSIIPYMFFVQTSPYSVDHNDEHVFGLVEGIYVFSGCLLVIILVVIAACCLASRKKKCFRPNADTVSSSDHSYSKNIPRCKDLFWRDNWLVQYHSNPAFNQSESDIYYLPESTNNSEPVTGKATESVSDRYDSYKNEEEDPYDNPWPLVRLDPNIVRKTKTLSHELHEPSKSEKSSTLCEYSISSNSDSAIIENSTVSRNKDKIERSILDNCIQAETGECFTNTLQEGNSKDDDTADKASTNGLEKNQRIHYRKNDKAYLTKGSFNIRRIKRSSSKSSDRKVYDNVTSIPQRDEFVLEQKNQPEHNCMNIDLDNLSLPDDLCISRHGHSSLCSDCSTNFGALIKQEIDKLESELGTDKDISTDESCMLNNLNTLNRISCETDAGNGTAGEWKVNTLYALVSQRGGATQPCGTTGHL